ncbi:MAG: PTS sugar transporter subunit IIA [Spirochaetes bacterium]|nr:PTS sugar transporter subunit IIA [Spirochaetota bacterium]
MNLKDYLFEYNTISLQAEANSWQSAVKLGTDLLVEAGTVEPRYYDAIIESTLKLGPYYILAPGMAMPHARPEGGVIRTGYSLVTLKTPVAFGDVDNDPIDILITMAAKDTETQNKSAIVQVVSLLDSEERVQWLKTAKNQEDLKRIFESLTDFE